MADTGTVELAREGAVATLTLSRPERKNALSREMVAALRAHAAALHADPALRAVIVTGAGGDFSAGADVSPSGPDAQKLLDAVAAKDPTFVREMLLGLRSALDALHALPVPVIAAIEGVAYGGGAELALACDLRVIAEAAALCFSETKLGLIPDLGGTVRLLDLVGRARTLDVVCTARKIDGPEALRLGLADRVAPAAGALLTARGLALEIASRGPAAVRMVKALVGRFRDLSYDGAMRAENEGAADVFLTGEFMEGIGAFFERRPPKW